MKNRLFLNFIIYLFPILAFANQNTTSPKNSKISDQGEYTLIVEGFDWGAAVSKVVLSIEDSISTTSGSDYKVEVERKTNCRVLSPEEAKGELKVLYTYLSDEKGNRIEKGSHLTLVLYVAPFEFLNSPIMYFGGNPACNGNRWVDFQLRITESKTHKSWNKESNRIIPLVDEFDLSGQFQHKDIKLTYAHFTPTKQKKKSPLIIWLHGAGEGGTDPSIALLANRAANYASPEIQRYFKGAYVLVPQTPTFWMDNGNSQYTVGEVNDKYNESLIELIKNFVTKHPQIDQDRIYVGGCSNGGYMTLKLILENPNFFAAGFPSALAYHTKHISDQQLETIKDVPMWFIHSKDDPVCLADETVTPFYHRLKKAKASNVHFSLFDHVVDITNQFGGKDFHYHGHFSWIYSHANKCQLDFDGLPVLENGQPVTLMGWMANQVKK